MACSAATPRLAGPSPSDSPHRPADVLCFQFGRVRLPQDLPGTSDEEGAGNARDPVGVTRPTVLIERHPALDRLALQERLDRGKRLIRERDEHDVLVPVLLGQLVEMGDAGDAGCAPGRPELDDYHLTFQMGPLGRRPVGGVEQPLHRQRRRRLVGLRLRLGGRREEGRSQQGHHRTNREAEGAIHTGQ